MSRETWQAMVQVMQCKQSERPKRRTRRPLLPVKSVREEHYELLLAAGY